MARGKPLDDLSFEFVANRLGYDPETGVLTWKVHLRGGSAKVGNVAGKTSVDGYRIIKINQRQYPAHRLAWLLTTGRWPVADIDHIDGNKSNNRLSNLREASRSQNNWNTIPVRGYSWDQESRKFKSKICVDRRCIFLGRFDSEDAARSAYHAAKERYHGEFWSRGRDQ